MLRRTVAVLCAAALAACGGEEGSAEELCTALRADRSSATLFAGFDPSDAERALQQLRAARVTLGELRDAAPDDLRDEIDIEIAYIQALVDGLAELDDPEPAEAVEVVRQVTADHPGVAEATQALDAFSQEECA